VIFWKDFLLDDVVGPVLALPEERLSTKSSREEVRLGSPNTRNGASGKQETLDVSIQETRQEQRPARMVGHSSHDSAQVDRMSVGSNRAITNLRPMRGEG
jgi:hypothetical protein